MKKKPKIGIIGVGNMGRALILSLSAANAYKLFAYDKLRLNQKSIKNCLRIKTSKELLAKSEVIVLAIKPQDVEQFLTENKEYIKAKQLFISIAAGIPIKFYERYLTKIKIIRVMPNLAATIGESISFISKGKHATNKDLRIAKGIFNSVGKAMIINESHMDKITSITGSGPGYVFYFMESMYQSALKLGFTKKQAKDMVLQTFLGAVKLAKNLDKDFKHLKDAVASKGGTTEAAFAVFNRQKIDVAVEKGIKSALGRSRAMAGKFLKGKR